MKKFLLLMSFIVAALIAKANQQYDERDLLGTWEITEREGSTPLWAYWEADEFCKGEIKFFQFGFDEGGVNSSYDIKDYELAGAIFWSNPLLPKPNGAGCYVPIGDFFISNGNKLHVVYGDDDYFNTLMLEIESFTDSELKLVSFNGKMRLTLTRITGTLVSADMSTADIEPTSIYTLDGMKVKEPGKGIHILKINNEENKKVLY